MENSQKNRAGHAALPPPSSPSTAWQGFNRYDAPAAPTSLYDPRTQCEVLARLIVEPRLLVDAFGDLTVTEFGGSVHQSLFRTVVKLAQEGKPFDIPELTEAWNAEKLVADPIIFLSDLVSTEGMELSRNLGGRVEKLQRYSKLRRILGFAQTVQHRAGSA